MLGEIDLLIVVILCCAYFAAGFIDSIAGGGGLIAIPAFLLTGIPPDLALGTNKLSASLGTASSLMTYARSGFVLWKIATLGLPAALVGAFIGSKTILFFDVEMIGKLVVFLLPLGILVTLIPKQSAKAVTELRSKDIWIFAPAICCVVGFYDGFFGPGTGSFFIIAFHFILRMSLVQASATAKIFNLATGAGGLIAFALQGKVLFGLAIPLAAANIAGNVIGSRMVIRIGAPFIRKVLIFSLFLLFSSLLWKFFLAG